MAIETPLQAHEYGALVLAYSHLEDFFSPQDVPIAREALRQWLWEQPEALKTAAALSPEGKNELDLLLHHRDQLREPLLREITLHKDEMAAVSPHGHLAQLHTQRLSAAWRGRHHHSIVRNALAGEDVPQPISGRRWSVRRWSTWIWETR